MKTFVAMIVLALPIPAIAGSFFAPAPWEQTITGTGWMQLSVMDEWTVFNNTAAPISVPLDAGATFLVGGWGGSEFDVAANVEVIAPVGLAHYLTGAWVGAWFTGDTDVVVLPDADTTWQGLQYTVTDSMFASVTSVPEPLTLWACLLLLLPAWACRRRKP
jgi:hypothetical protein